MGHLTHYEPGVDAPVPNICFLCEQRPQTGYLIDTGLNHTPDTVPATRLHGRKMLCNYCARRMGVEVGMVDEKAYQEVAWAHDRLQLERRELAKQVEDLTVGHLEAFRELLEKRTFTKPGPKGPRAKPKEAHA